MGEADGKVVGVEKVVDNGPDAQNWNLVIMGDGFTKDEQGKFQEHVKDFVRHMQGTAPFSENAVWHRVNVHRIDVWSNESGADNPLTCGDGSSPVGGVATTAATYFDASFCNDGDRRSLWINDGLALTTAASKVPNVHNILVAVNSEEDGGTGGVVGCYSLVSDALDAALHELGHVVFNLGDEYEYGSTCFNVEKDHEIYAGDEPTEPNITKNGTDRATLKWRHLVDKATSIPTTTHTLCIVCPPQTNPVSDSTVGAFVGAGTFHCGLYRPMFNCKMRQTDQPFCVVCQDAIRRKLAVTTPPSGVTTPPSGSCFVAGAVYGDPFHPDVEQLRRWRDARLEPGARGRLAMRAMAATYGRLGPLLAPAVRRSPLLSGLLRARLFGPVAGALRRRERRGGA